ncbi:hypothetical protein [Pseudosulfitobacter sp. SM2401]|uniref:hypothetical protein n=1 Tax=Pseudosulfitobacter sp. SM2401 TaxID=3350098 RepID=UPI0036F269C2
MTLSDEHIAKVRSLGMLGVGGSCLLYAVLALIQNRPDPMLWFIPLAIGVLAAIVIWTVFLIAGRGAAQAASDELFLQTTTKAQRHAYWIALSMFALFAYPLISGMITWATGFAAMGTITGAAHPLLFVIYEWRDA